MSTKQSVGNIESFQKKYGALSLGRFISGWRISEGISQRAFAKKIGVSAANLCDIEKGRKGVSLYKATDIAKRIGYSPTILVQLVLQEQVTASGLRYRVELKAEAA